jgi:glucose dehydrogenase
MPGSGRLAVLTSSLLAAAALAQTNGARGARRSRPWTAYGGGADSSQYSALDQINTSNVSDLKVAWTVSRRRHGHLQPARRGRRDVLQASGDTLAAVDAATGKEIWRKMPPRSLRGALAQDTLAPQAAAAERMDVRGSTLCWR